MIRMKVVEDQLACKDRENATLQERLKLADGYKKDLEERVITLSNQID